MSTGEQRQRRREAIRLTATIPYLVRTPVALLAALGLFGVLPVSLDELRTGGACPHLGPIPACHIVALSYALMLAAALSRHVWSWGLFYLGWLPVFLLAAGGSALELLGQDICPKTEGGWPKCFFSFALAVAIASPVLAFWFFARRPDKQSGD